MRDLEALTALFETSRTLGISEDVDSLLDEILQRAQELTGFDHCALMLLDPEHGDLVARRVLGYGDRREAVVGLRLPVGRGLSGWAAENRAAVNVGDVSQDARYVRGLENARSNLAVPLLLANQVVGVLNVESQRGDAFDERHEKLLTVLGTQAALAIVASRAQVSLQQQVAQLDALYRISRLTWAGKSLDDVVEAVLEETGGIVPSGGSALLLLDAGRHQLMVRADRGYDRRVEGMRIGLDQGITGRCARRGEPQVVADVTSDPDYIEGVPGARCEVALPLVVEGRVIGVLNVESPEALGLRDDQVRTLSVIAQQVATVVHTTQLQEERLRLAITDPLTGLFNRRYFQERLEQAMLRCQRYQEGLALVLLDLDHFKAINDEHGHEVGDLVLARVAEALRARIRRTDILARIGGEEYAVVVARPGLAHLATLAERLRATVAEVEVAAEGRIEVRVTTSIGVAHSPAPDEDTRRLFRRADRALYEAKHGGRDRVVLDPPLAAAEG